CPSSPWRVSFLFPPKYIPRGSRYIIPRWSRYVNEDLYFSSLGAAIRFAASRGLHPRTPTYFSLVGKVGRGTGPEAPKSPGARGRRPRKVGVWGRSPRNNQKTSALQRRPLGVCCVCFRREKSHWVLPL